MKKIILLLIIAFVQDISFAQTPNWVWAKGVTIMPGSSSEFTGMSVDLLGNVYFIGTFNDTSITFDTFTLTNPYFGATNGSVFLAKYDSLGNFLWVRTVIATAGTFLSGVTNDVSGNVIITGGFRAPKAIFETDTLINTDSLGGSFDFFLVKYNSSGNLIWSRSGRGDNQEFGICLTTDSSGNIIASGIFSSSLAIFGSDTIYNSHPGYHNIFLVKYSPSGVEIYCKSAGGFYDDYVYAITNDNAGNTYITGSYNSPTIIFGSDTLANFDTASYTQDMFIVKYNSFGTVVYANSFGGTNKDEAYYCISDLSGNVYVAGYFKSPIISFGSYTLSNSGFEDAFLVKYNSSGNVIYAKSIGGNGHDNGYNISVDIYNNIYFSGGFTSSSITLDTTTLTFPTGGTDPAFYAKYDSTGNILFARALQSGGDDLISIVSYGTNDLYIGGDFYGVHPFILGNDSLNTLGVETPFIAKLSYSNTTVGITNVNTQQFYSIYPNPCTSQINLTFSEEQKNTLIKITDVLGKEIRTINFTGTQLIIEKGEMGAGVYFVQITDQQKNTTNKKIIIQ